MPCEAGKMGGETLCYLSNHCLNWALFSLLMAMLLSSQPSLTYVSLPDILSPILAIVVLYGCLPLRDTIDKGRNTQN